MATQLFFSNDIEKLAGALCDEIYRRPDPFDPLTIVIPNPYLQKWLQLEIAARHGIAINLSFRFLNDGLWEILDYCNPSVEKPSLLDQKDIQLLVYHAITAIKPESPPMGPLYHYLFNNDATLRSDYDYKTWQLAARLARYFTEYELFREDMIAKWYNGSINVDDDMEHIQQQLYTTLFKKGGYRDTIKSDWLTLPQYWNRTAARLTPHYSHKLVFFGESLYSPFHAKMIFELGKHLDLSVYQVNPCSEFWEDVTTPGEDRWSRLRSITVEETETGDSLPYDSNENPLLKLWGKSGRETMKLLSLIEEAGSSEDRCVSSWIDTGMNRSIPTTLTTVQNHILRRTTGDNPSDTITQDTSIQVASCPDIFRETETVFNSILHNLHHDESLTMTDIAVMVPDMNLYGPVIHSIFSREPRRVAYSMIDSTASYDSIFAKAVTAIIEIASGSFTRKEVFALVRNPCFYEAHAMSVDDAWIWLQWADNLCIFRDFNKADCVDPAQNLYTWQQGLQRLRFGRIMGSQNEYTSDGHFPDYHNIIPYTDSYTGDQHRINVISCIIELLHHRTKSLITTKTTAAGWIRLIKDLIADFLTIPADRPDETLVYTTLLENLDKTAILDHISNDAQHSLLSLTVIKELIKDALIDIPCTRGSYLTSGINISALVPKRQIPFKIIYVMGMQEGLFPGSHDTSTLNLMNKKRRIGDPTRPDINRYLFLETLLAAKDKLYITYISKDLQKDQDFHPNSVTGQLIAYLNNHILPHEFSICDVPPTGRSIRYAQFNPATASYSDLLHSYKQRTPLLVHYNSLERLALFQKVSRMTELDRNTDQLISKKIHDVTPQFKITPPSVQHDPELVSVSLNDLRRFLINPIESYLHWHLNIHDDRFEDAAIQEHEPFYSKFPADNSFIVNSLNHYLHSHNENDIGCFTANYYRYTKLMSGAPDGAFGDIDFEALHSDILKRLTQVDNLIEFVENRKACTEINGITIGPFTGQGTPEKSFPSLLCPILLNSRNLCIEVHGSLPLVWKNPETRTCETIVITNSSEPSLSHLLTPFLFYVVSAALYNEEIGELVGSGPFVIHVSYRKGISSYRYHLDYHESRDYLQRLLTDFMNTERLDLLPLAIITKKGLIQAHEMNNRPGAQEQIDYCNTLRLLIEEDAESLFPSYRSMELLTLIDASVPSDAYHKVRDRLGILVKPFSGSPSA